MAHNMSSRRRAPNYHNEVMDLRSASAAGSVSGASVASSGGVSRASKGSAFEAKVDNSFDVKARRPPSPTSSTVSFASRRGSRPLVHPSREDALHDAVHGEDNEGEEGEESRGIFGLMDAAGDLGSLLLGKSKSVPPLRIPDKRAPGFKSEVIKYLYSQHPHMVTLDMADCALVDNDVPRLSDAIGTCTVLRSLSLATNSITHESMEDLTIAIEASVSLNSIDLGENALGVRGATILARNLIEKTKLMGLDLSSNLIRDEGCRAVLDALQQTPGQPIQWLSLSENCISDHSAADLASLIDTAKNLTFLDLSRNAFFSNGMRVIAEELGLNNTLQHLNLSNISLDAEAVELLGASLARNRGLISLDMYGCRIGDVGARVIGASLTQNTYLRRLDLGSNKIGSSGCSFLADGLMVNTVLHVLRLWGNTLGLACDRLLSALYTNDTLIQIDLTGCSTDVDTVAMIGALVKKNRLAENGRSSGSSEIRKLRKALAKEQLKTDLLTKKAKSYKKKHAKLLVDSEKNTFGGAQETGYDSALSMDSDGGRPKGGGGGGGDGGLQHQDSIFSTLSDESEDKAWWDIGSLGKGLPISTAGLPASFDFFRSNATSADSF